MPSVPTREDHTAPFEVINLEVLAEVRRVLVEVLRMSSLGGCAAGVGQQLPLGVVDGNGDSPLHHPLLAEAYAEVLHGRPAKAALHQVVVLGVEVLEAGKRQRGVGGGLTWDLGGKRAGKSHLVDLLDGFRRRRCFLRRSSSLPL
jgi:hypothetical protein